MAQFVVQKKRQGERHVLKNNNNWGANKDSYCRTDHEVIQNSREGAELLNKRIRQINFTFGTLKATAQQTVAHLS